MENENQYPYYNMAAPEPVQPVTPKKKEKKKGGLGRKIFTALLCGVLFGVAAGGCFIGVNVLSDRLGIGSKGNVSTEEEKVAALTEQETEESGQTADASQTGSDTVQYPTVASTLSNASQDSSYTLTLMDASGVAELCMPSMVAIVNTYTESYTYWGQKYTQTAQASGTGIIIGQTSDELLIVSNYHVVEDCESLEITFIDDTTANAYMKGYDEEMDIAVVSVQLQYLSEDTLNNIAVAVLGDSDTVKVGEPAIVIGNALGYGQSVTAGIISALNRDLTIDGNDYTLIQTDAAINPGNSGGALLNAYGQVIGISSSKIGAETVEGMCYAIPISLVKDLIAELSLKETMIRVESGQEGYLGIYGQDVDSNVSAMYDIPQGVYISQVIEGLAAEKAGLQKGDIIVSLAGSTITSMEDLTHLLQYHAAGTDVEVVIERKVFGVYTEMTLTVTLGSKE